MIVLSDREDRAAVWALHFVCLMAPAMWENYYEWKFSACYSDSSTFWRERERKREEEERI